MPDSTSAPPPNGRSPADGDPDELLLEDPAPESATFLPDGADDPSALAPFAAPADPTAPAAVTRTLLARFLGKEATQARIRQVIAARIQARRPKADADRAPVEVERKAVDGDEKDVDIDDIAQRVNVRALMTKALPKEATAMRAWISAIAGNETHAYYREQGRSRRQLERAIEKARLVEDDALVEPDPDAAPVAPEAANADADVLATWLKTQRTTAADELTLEMIRHKAATRVDNAQLAAEFGMTESAFDNRLLRFKAKWTPGWKREKARRLRALLLLSIVLLLLVAAALAWLARPRPRPADTILPLAPVVEPVVEPPVPPAPSASGARDPTFEQAAPRVVPVATPPREDTKQPEK